MRIIDQELQIPDFDFTTRLSVPGTVYIDIETTGFNRRRSHLYLLGAMWLKNRQPILRQWFAERPADEETIIRDFFSFCVGFKHLVQFNGSSFDLPYLQHKAAYYGIETASLPKKITDLYQQYRVLKDLLGQSDMKLTNLEARAGYLRTDQHTGKELIKVYENYLQTADETLLSVLLQHNTDDIAGMLWLEVFDSLLALQGKTVTPTGCQSACDPGTGCLVFTCSYDMLFFPSLTVTFEDNMTLTLNGHTALLAVPVYEGTLYHFFRDYQNYYYFPAEDRALHKSVALYADSSSRIRATRETACEPHTGLFLRTFAPLDTTPCFQPRDCAFGQYYICYEDTFLQNTALCTTYATHITSALLTHPTAPLKG